jgi:hypothetical protein
MGNAKRDSNERRDRKELVTFRSLHREVQSYRDNNERIMKAQEEILHILNMLHKQVNKDYGTKQKACCKVARDVVGGPIGPIVIIVEAIQCKMD